MDLLNLLETLAGDKSFHDSKQPPYGYGQYELLIQASERRHGKTKTWDKIDELIQTGNDAIKHNLLYCLNWRRDPDTDKQRFTIALATLENPGFETFVRTAALRALAIFEDSDGDFEDQISIIRRLHDGINDKILKSHMTFNLLFADKPKTMNSNAQLIFTILCYLDEKSNLENEKQEIMTSVSKYGKNLTINALKFAINHSALSSFGQEFGKTMLEVMT